MYPSSAEYLAAITASDRVSRIEGEITLLDNTTIAITDDDIVSGSLYISEQSVSGEDLDVGSVYAAEMGIALTVPLVNPYALEGARISLYYGLQVTIGEETSFEYVPLGTYYVTDINREPTAVRLTALDGMIRLDVDLTDVAVQGTAQALLASVAVKLGMTLVMPDTYPNDSVILTVPLGNAVKTCRDLVMWTCHAIGCFARMGRLGELEICQHHTTIDRVIGKSGRMRTRVSDNTIKITQVSMEVGDAVYLSGEEGMTMTLEANPLVATDDVQSVLDNLLAVITAIEYVPHTTELIGDPSFQAGDCIELTDTSSLAVNVTTIITHSTWRYRGAHNIRGVGKALTRGLYDQQQKAIAAVKTTAANAQILATAANQAAVLINSAIGGHVLIRQNPESTNEILIMDSPDPATATKIWRWNLNGLGYSDNVTGADNPDRTYKVAITMDGRINAEFIAASTISADLTFVGQLFGLSGTFKSLIAGVANAQRIHIGADDNEEPFFDVYDNTNTKKVHIGKKGLTINGVRLSGYNSGDRTGVGFYFV
jgi:hypothetical protein